jgi:hypothetical protein
LTPKRAAAAEMATAPPAAPTSGAIDSSEPLNQEPAASDARIA